jgi:hypothetical protein
VRVHHDEGVANRIDPESCADAREGIGEALGAPRRLGVVVDTGMCGRSLLGNRETPRLATGALPIWSASGRRGAVADDARMWGVRLRHSS